MDNLGQSKKALEEGIQCIEKVEQWYKNQLDAIEDQFLIVEQIDEISDQEINFNVNEVHDLNCRMSQLVAGSNLETSKPNEMNANQELQRRIERLQEQNRMLTTEISRQSNRVTALEQDKRSLIKQLFQQSS